MCLLAARKNWSLHPWRRRHDGPVGRGSWDLFEFVGVLEILELGIECGKYEVRYEMVEKVRPMDGSMQFVPPPEKLNAVRHQRPGSQNAR